VGERERIVRKTETVPMRVAACEREKDKKGDMNASVCVRERERRERDMLR
jgi:hypothetical protein